MYLSAQRPIRGASANRRCRREEDGVETEADGTTSVTRTHDHATMFSGILQHLNSFILQHSQQQYQHTTANRFTATVAAAAAVASKVAVGNLPTIQMYLPPPLPPPEGRPLLFTVMPNFPAVPVSHAQLLCVLARNN